MPSVYWLVPRVHYGIETYHFHVMHGGWHQKYALKQASEWKGEWNAGWATKKDSLPHLMDTIHTQKGGMAD